MQVIRCLCAMAVFVAGLASADEGASSKATRTQLRGVKPMLVGGELPAVPPELLPRRTLTLHVEYGIAADGTVRDVQVSGTRDRALLKFFSEAVRKLRYKPMKIEGEAAEARVKMDLTLPGIAVEQPKQ